MREKLVLTKYIYLLYFLYLGLNEFYVYKDEPGRYRRIVEDSFLTSIAWLCNLVVVVVP